ncbi:MAG: PQQ-binding-like beta-propeller repeat protein [Acidimicrobiales bacterium]|nr:PQQ-binding-like beta-propeller repeat protein [Acidimicrobiales bacterium]
MANPTYSIGSEKADFSTRRWAAAAGVVVVIALLGWGVSAMVGSDDGSESANKSTVTVPNAPATTKAPEAPGLAPQSSFDGWVDPASSGLPWSTKVVGQLTFRGNPTRSFYGHGPMPSNPSLSWKYPESGGLCGQSSVGGAAKSWCGTGWTGQPSVWEQDGKTWVAVGTYDKHIHFFDAETGDALLEPFDMGDIIKGSLTKDPDGYPLIYSGSRADFHIIALDRDDGKAADLWSMNADDVSPTKWNDDWDSSPLVIDDYLFEGGENGQWYIIKLNRGKGPDGKVTVDPKIVFHAPGWDDQLMADLAGSGSRRNDVSIENSLAISGNTVYFANSGGLVQGWDISGVKKGEDPKRVFRFWTGDDTDASIVIDAKGMLYVASERERASSFERDDEVGQLMKLDPSNPDNPLVWKVNDPAEGAPGAAYGSCEEHSCYGIWATPAIYNGMVYVGTNHGRILGVDQQSGRIVWEKKLPGPTWQSPVVVDDVLLQGDCSGVLHAYDVSNPKIDPPELWTVEVEGCIESTPAVFKGKIFFGARGGKFYAFG